MNILADQGVAAITIDWAAPWFTHLQTTGKQADLQTEWREAMNRHAEQMSLLNHRHLPIRFIRQEDKPDNLAYETCISSTGQVPTRNNLHDFFNALVWLRFPSIKRALNTVQAAEIARHGIQASRGRTRDAATLFDENGALFVVRENADGDAMIHAWRNHDWQSLFVRHRHEFHRCCDVVLFGHALLEKLVQPYKAITAHAWCVRTDDSYFHLPTEQRMQWLDHAIGGQWHDPDQCLLHPAQFSPLPVLGIPGWWPQQDAAFYSDESVFRSKRMR